MKTQKPYYITTEKISVGYDGKPLIEEVEIALRKGEILTLLGPNGAGKSTILKSIARQLSLIAGTVRLDGEDMRTLTGAELSKKMAVVMTKRLRGELMTCEDVVATGRYPYTGRFGVLRAEDHAAVQNAMELVQVAEIGDSLFDRISDGQRQRVMLARAICQGPEILILDEPTSSLDEQEVEKLFKLMLDLKSRGVGIIFVTHFLDQVYAVCDKITVLRDGKFEGEYNAADLPKVELVSKMLGKDLNKLSDMDKPHEVEQETNGEAPVFEAEGLVSSAGIAPFNFSIRKGEVNGFTGLLGSGRSESVRAIFGADSITGGTVRMNGKTVKIRKPLDAMKHGISYLPEDRKHDGIIGDLSVKDNIILALQVMRGMFRPISKADAAKYADEYIKLLEIKTASPDTPIKSLSGGNQQKVILARWLLANPVYLILDEPTRGIDVGTKLEIQKLVLKLAAEGKSVTFISSEIDEMLNVCSRLIVMRDRKTAGELTGSDLNQSKIMETIAGGEKVHENA